MITKASMEEAEKLYKECIEKDFPDDEIPSYNQFVKLTKENIHTIYLYKQDNQNVAYFITVECNNNILISHLAVIKEFRSITYSPDQKEYTGQEIKKIIEEIYSKVGLNKAMLKIEVN